jgi:hypothetical protein
VCRIGKGLRGERTTNSNMFATESLATCSTKVTLKEVVRERVSSSAMAGIEGMEAIAARRAEIISALKNEALQLNQDMAALEQRLR